MKVKIDVDKKRTFGREFSVVQCEKCGVFYEPYGKEHKCKKSARWEVSDVFSF